MASKSKRVSSKKATAKASRKSTSKASAKVKASGSKAPGSRRKKVIASSVALALLGANYARQKAGITFEDLNPFAKEKKQTLRERLLGQKPRTLMDKILGRKQETRFDRLKYNAGGKVGSMLGLGNMFNFSSLEERRKKQEKKEAEWEKKEAERAKSLKLPARWKILGSKSVSGPSAPALSAPPAYSA